MNWIFRPTLSMFDIFMIVIMAEWLVPIWGLWTFLLLFPLFVLSTSIERNTWKVTPHDR